MSLPWFKRPDAILHPRPRHLTASAPKLPGKTWGAVNAAVSASTFATRNIGPTASALKHEHGNLMGKGALKPESNPKENMKNQANTSRNVFVQLFNR